ncbi:YheC/YheD family protein [Xylanibacillus composti]|uniref:YheC/YheD family protein n=1 Tax=Xylanibacillus composti TaxID=1572762 RepID=A0A8J4H5F9_9BACL|nr:YheC/YheD family protein [Xylanibacillus composti]MDT9724776.1 YheC/YheD family protein [Xylanibacillus composti]GIQ69871.1 hypothetical protein XYCOK13_26950 [Xylanibacillus composti]
MSISTCQVLVTKRPARALYATSALIKSLSLKPGKTVRISFGKAETTVTLRSVKKSGSKLYVPLNIKNQLLLPHIGTFKVKSSNGSLRIGPLFGIMTTANPSATSPFGTRTSLIRQFVASGSQAGTCFAFAPKNIDWATRSVTGYFYSPGKGWYRRKAPLPDVIYNRMPSRKTEKSANLVSLKYRLTHAGIPLFNWSFFEKWDIYRLLEPAGEAYKHVPQSILNPSPRQLKGMLDNHDFVYLKPTGGSLGKGIYRLTYKPHKGYFVRYRLSGRNRVLRFAKFSGLARMIGIDKGRLRNYVAQQGIRLLEIDGCPIDFRFHLIKNIRGRWTVAGIGCKKAGKGSVTTHVRTGGQLLTPGQALGRIYSASRAQDLLDKAKAVSIQLAEAIERESSHPVGELGFDLGIDKDGRIWMFEANAKPGRSIYKHPALKNEGRATLKLLFDYCTYLSGFNGGDA